MRIYTVLRPFSLYFHSRANAALPAVHTVKMLVPVIFASIAVKKFKAAVLYHFSMQSPVQPIVDVLEEKAEHAGINAALDLIGDDHKYSSIVSL